MCVGGDDATRKCTIDAAIKTHTCKHSDLEMFAVRKGGTVAYLITLALEEGISCIVEGCVYIYFFFLLQTISHLC